MSLEYSFVKRSLRLLSDLSTYTVLLVVLMGMFDRSASLLFRLLLIGSVFVPLFLTGITFNAVIYIFGKQIMEWYRNWTTSNHTDLEYIKYIIYFVCIFIAIFGTYSLVYNQLIYLPLLTSIRPH